ncbi:MAG: hypothetical protein EXQ96_10240 [Alphaproteobacteria bacterium]|nr:hypothetical protein [Alphaproteobacteria bacterium]
MSRLDSFIRRLEAQRACLEHAAALITDLEGCVLEFGLGNGRTYDHLRHLFPSREIFAFDRQVAAHPSCVPDAAHLFLGDFSATVPAAIRRLLGTAALAHFDIGSGDVAATAALAATLAAAAPPLLARGGVILADQPMAAHAWAPLPLPPGVPEGRYFLYRVR